MRLNISIDDESLAAIDAAAEAAGESRSEYLRRAALERASSEQRGLTAAQQRKVLDAVRAALGAC